nr:reverse transcriptase domain-containing protein [Tanacetum cinerariifolium]
MKQLIAELPMLTVPMEKEELIVYLAATKETVSAVSMTERKAKQMPIYFVSRALRDFIVKRPEEDSTDTPMEEEGELPEPWILFTDGSSCTDGSGAGLILTNPDGMDFTYALRFRFDATNNEAEYEALIVGLWIAEQMGVKNLQANVDSHLVANQVNEAYVAKEADMIRYLEKIKALTGNFRAFLIKQIPRSENKKADALSKIASTSFAHLSKQGTLPADVKKARAIRRKSWRFAVINETLYKTSFLGPWLRCVGPLQANYVLREIHKGSYSMHAGTRSVVAKALRTGYYWTTMHKDARTLIRACPGKVKLLIVAMDYFTKWIEAKLVTTITGNQIKKFVCDNIVCTFRLPGEIMFGLPGEIISDNGKKFRDDPFKDWYEKLSLGERIKARLDARSKNWIEELPHVLWAHRTMIKSSNGDTPFSLTYGTKAVIPAEIGMPTLGTAEVDLVGNNEALEIDLDLLEEKREEAAIREAKSKAKMEKYYNSKV